MKDFEAIHSLIESHDVITIWGHAMPDGDCYGCQIALREILRENYPNKKIYAIGSGIPSLFARMSRMDEIDDEEIKSSLGILVDVNCLERVEDQRVRLCSRFTKIDHHRSNGNSNLFPYRPYYVDHSKIAAAEIIAEFAFAYSYKINKLAAEAIYLGIYTDSGEFQFWGTTERTLQIAQQMIEIGAEPGSILEIVYHEEDQVKAYKAYLRQNIKEVGQVGYVYASRADYQRFQIPYEQASSFANSISKATSCPIYALLTEDSQGNIRAELRSNKGYPVHKVAVKYGGGGHLFASGISIKGTVPDYRDIIHDLNQLKPCYNGRKEKK